MPSTITITNDGPELRGTDYWDSPFAAKGLVFASWNAGVLRVLLPDAMRHAIADMRGAASVVVTRGQMHGRAAIEIMFDDDSDAPFALHIETAMTDRSLPESESGGLIAVALWTREGKIHEWPGRFRVGSQLHDMSPWSTH